MIRDIKRVIWGLLEKNQGAVFSIVFTVGTALAGGFLYVVGYSFLYGYYFGGKDVALFGSSLLPVFVNPVPFDRQGVLITGFIFLVMLAFCIFAYRLLTRLKGDWLLPVVSAVIAFTAVNLLICTFFLGELSPTVMILWAAPVIVAPNQPRCNARFCSGRWYLWQ